MDPNKPSPEHLAALNRRRRIVVNFDVTFAINTHYKSYPEVLDLVEHLFGFADDPGTQIDSIWWNWGEGNQAPYASQHLPLYDHPLYQQWVDEGTDVVGLVLEATRKRGLETFFSHRMNGSDNDLGPFARIPLKVQHPEWLFRTPWCTHPDNGYWNFALPQVHAHTLEALREIAERWPFDGMELDFARGVVFPQGQGWTHRQRLTDFITQVRDIFLAIGSQRGRPMLLAARVPETLVGCHFDGLDIERWTRQGLVDILALGVRSYDVDLSAFRRIVEGTPVKLYPSLEDHHSTDGYQNPSIEVFRGVASNWWQQGADGIHTFNLNYAEDRPYKGQDWQSHLQAYQEIGSRETLMDKNKTFVVQRRGGGHGPSVVPNPDDWFTPRHAYANTNMLSPLPTTLANDDKIDTLLQIYISDDLAHKSDQVSTTTLHLLLSDPAAETLPTNQRLDQVTVATIGHPKGGLLNIPVAKGIEKDLRVRLNNIPLKDPHIEAGWLVFKIATELFAVGENLLGIGVEGRAADAPQLFIEKVEVRIKYSVDN